VTSTFRALTTTVSVDIAADVTCRDLLETLIESYAATTDSPTLSYVIGVDSIERDGALLCRVDEPLDLAPRFELDLYEQLVARAAPGWLVHAAAIDIDGTALVVAGPSGAGKTTLALAFVGAGYRLLTEEMVLIRADATAVGLSRPMHVRDASSLPASWRRAPYPMREATGLEIREQLVVPDSASLQRSPLPVRALVRLTHGADRPSQLERIAASQALPRLWDTTLRADDDGLRVATSVLREVPAYRLASRRFDEAWASVQELLTTK